MLRYKFQLKILNCFGISFEIFIEFPRESYMYVYQLYFYRFNR